MTYDSNNLTVTEQQEGTGAGDYPIVTRTYYYPDNLGSTFTEDNTWIIGREKGTATWRYPGTGLDVVVLGMKRTTYPILSPFRPSLHERLLFPEAGYACRNPGDPFASAPCTSAGRWIALLQNPTYDAYGNLIYAEGMTTPTHPNKHKTTWTYDDAYQGLVRTETRRRDNPDGTLAATYTRSITYDAAGRPLIVTDENGWVRTMRYDVFGRVTSIAEPDATSTCVIGRTSTGALVNGPCTHEWNYPELGRAPGVPLLSTEGYRVQHRAHSGPSQVHLVERFLDGFGSERLRVDRSGAGVINVESFATYSNGLPVRWQSLPYRSGDVRQYVKTLQDQRGRPVSIDRVNASFSPIRNILRYGYGACREGSNVVGSLVSRQGPVAGQRIDACLDARGLVRSATDGRGNATRYRYDTALNLIEVTLPTKQDFVRFTYDGWGRRTSEDDAAGAGFTLYTYDDGGNLTARTQYPAGGGQTAPTSSVSFRYDGLDRVIAELDSNGNTQVTYRYDERPPAGASYRTHPNGRLSSVTDPTGTTLFAYDARGRIHRTESTVIGLADRFVRQREFDDQGRPTQQTFPAGLADEAVEKRTYSVDGLLIQMEHNKVVYAAYAGHNARKQPRTVSVYRDPASGVFADTTTYTYDDDARVRRISTTSRAGSLLLDDGYGYDNSGNLTSIKDARRQAQSVSNGIDTSRTFSSLGYDNLDRLISAESTLGGVTRYDYDLLGNVRVDGPDVVSQVACPATCGTQRCITSTRGQATQWVACHDSEGKRTRFIDHATAPATQWTYGYDYRGRLNAVARDGVEQERYAYNFAGLRTWRATRLPTTRLTTWSFGDYEIQQNSGDPTKVSRSWHVGSVATLTAGDLIKGQTNRDTVLLGRQGPYSGNLLHGNAQDIYLKVADRLGTTALVTSRADGNPVTRHWFDPWGVQRTQCGGTSCGSLGVATVASGYTGQAHDNASGLVYLRARYYDPRSKRFLTPDDRVTGNGLTAQGFNRFSYVQNNPSRYIDPTGHKEGSCITHPDGSKTCDAFWDLNDESQREIEQRMIENLRDLAARGGVRRGVNTERREERSLTPPRDIRWWKEILTVERAQEWLISHYPQLIPADRVISVGIGDPGKGNTGATDHITGNVTIAPNLLPHHLIDTLAHELLHARDPFWERIQQNMLQVLTTDLTPRHKAIYLAGLAISSHYQVEQRNGGQPVQPGGDRRLGCHIFSQRRFFPRVGILRRMTRGRLVALLSLAMMLSGSSNECTRTAVAVKTVSEALSIYEERHGRYPATLEALTQNAVLQTVPSGAWETPLIYRTGGTSSTFELRSAGADGIEGTGDDITAADPYAKCSIGVKRGKRGQARIFSQWQLSLLSDGLPRDMSV